MSDVIPMDVGRRPALEWVAINAIRVDHNYQRELKPARVQKILKDFSWRKFGAVVLARHDDGTFTVIDGQHRVAGARSHPKIDAVPAAVLDLADAQEEADAFLGVNVNRSAITTVERYWAGIAAGDPAMVRVRDVLARAKCEVIQAIGVKPSSRKTNAVSAVERSIRLYGEEATASACRVLAAGWSSDSAALGAVSIQALARLFRNNKAVIKEGRMEEKLRTVARKQLAGQAETLKKLGGGDAVSTLCRALVEIYNKGLQHGHIQIGVRA